MAEVLSAGQSTGPLYSFALCFDGADTAVAADHPDAVRISGRVIDGNGDAVRFPDALIEFALPDQFARSQANENGEYSVLVAKPTRVPVLGGHPQAPHLNVVVFIHPILEHFYTRVYFPDEEDANRTDPVLSLVDEARRARMIAEPVDGGLRFDIHLQGERESVFFRSPR